MYRIFVVCMELFVLVCAAVGFFTGRRKITPGFLAAGYSVYCLKRKLWRRLGVWEAECLYYKHLHVNERPEEVQLKAGCKQGLAILGAVAAFGIVILLMGTAGDFSEKEITTLKRPAEGTQVHNLSAWVAGERYEIAVALTQKQLTAQEVQAHWLKAKESLPLWILGENTSLSSVSRDLDLPRFLPGTAIEIQWYSSDYALINPEGGVLVEELEGDAQDVLLTAELSYGEWVEHMEIPVRVVAPSANQKDSVRENIFLQLQDELAAQGYEETVALPKAFADKEIKYYEEPAHRPEGVFLLVCMAIVGIFAASESAHKRKKEERLRQMQRDYPEVVTKLTLLLEAGLSIRCAWSRMAAEYLRYAGGRKKRRYVYEEMLHTDRQMQVGMSEKTAYAQFGKRCGTILYLRFGSVLVQNLQMGSRSIVPLLKKEAQEALCERKERARQLGEEAGTKLLLPMAGMLVLVLVIVMIPAFLSF